MMNYSKSDYYFTKLVGLDLHNRGLASIMELQTEIIVQELDIISRPMWWGISMEVGSKLPFSHAYFPNEQDLLRILAGPISKNYFQNLLYKISGSLSQAGSLIDKSSWKTTSKINAVDHESMWYILKSVPYHLI